MSTEDTNKVVVTLRKGVDADAFIQEMNEVGNSSPYVPQRAVEVYNYKPESLRNVDFVMTREEMENLKQDQRVLHCRWGTKAENNVFLTKHVVDLTRTYTRTTGFATGNIDMNWGLPQVNSRVNLFNSSSINHQFSYTLTGNGVDFVVQDSGLQVNHPEFTDANGVSRVQQINWFTATGFSGTMPSNFYTDVVGHGTHVCGIAAGKTYGWAKNASIYVMNILGYNASSTLSPSRSFALLRAWHENKSVGSTGYKRPTVVNMSWGYYSLPSDSTSGVYRGVPWTGAGARPEYGLIDYGGYNEMPGVDVATEADAEDAMDAGVILVGAAGNFAYKQDVPGGLDWDNYAMVLGQRIYYHRGNSPIRLQNVIRVGSIDLNYLTERKSRFSDCGPGVDVWAPGSYIAGPTSNIADLGGYPMAQYPYNPNYNVGKMSGTSQASPQVAGLISTILEARPWATAAECKEFITKNATMDRLISTGTGYTDYYSLQDSPNRYLYNPFNTSTPTVTTNLTATITGKL